MGLGGTLPRCWESRALPAGRRCFQEPEHLGLCVAGSGDRDLLFGASPTWQEAPVVGAGHCLTASQSCRAHSGCWLLVGVL